MSKTTAALMLGIVLVIGYFLYQWLVHSPCDALLQQTAPQLEGNIKLIKSEGKVSLSQPQVQELSEAAQRLGIYLKSCCVLAQMGKVDAGQCVAKANEIDRHITEVATNVRQAKAAQEGSNPQLVEEKTEKVQEAVSKASLAEEELAQISKAAPRSTPATIASAATFAKLGNLEGGRWTEQNFDVPSDRKDGIPEPGDLLTARTDTFSRTDWPKYVPNKGLILAPTSGVLKENTRVKVIKVKPWTLKNGVQHYWFQYELP